MTHSEEEQEFYAEIGRTITQWARIELALFWVALRAGVRPQGASGAFFDAFFSIENFRSKAAFVDVLVKDSSLFKGDRDKLLEDWGTLLARVQKVASIRNKIAHLRVTEYPSRPGGKRFGVEKWDVSKKRDQDKPADGTLHLRDIIATRYKIEALFYALRNFSMRLSGEPEPHPKSDEQEQDPPTIRAIENQIRARQGRQPKPSRVESDPPPRDKWEWNFR